MISETLVRWENEIEKYLVMRKFLFFATLFFGVLTCQAQEKVMNILRTDGTLTPTRVADLKQISFLTADAGGQGLLVKMVGGESTSVLFETHPVVTVSNGRLNVRSDAADPVEFEISDISEIVFSDPTGVSPIVESEGFSCVLQDGGVMLRGIPSGVRPCVYSVDGRLLPTPPFQGDELLLSRASLGKGLYVVKVGTFSVKIQL